MKPSGWKMGRNKKGERNAGITDIIATGIGNFFGMMVEKIRKAIPDISLTTDIIVGFPGETEEDFQETLDVVAKCGYDTAFTFLYSKRSDTPAAAMENQVPQDVAKERFNRLLALVQKEGRTRSSRFEGSIQEVLVEEESKEKGIFTGYANHSVQFSIEKQQVWELFNTIDFQMVLDRKSVV